MGSLGRLKGYLLFLKGRLKRPALWTWDWLADVADRAFGRRGDLTPPRRHLRYVGSGDFHAVGREFLGHLRDLAGLQPSQTVLDVGSGIGRIAVALTSYLDTRGSYEGFDIVPLGVQWCRRTITPRYPNFRFHLADVYNKFYYPRGRFRASEYPFPYETETFDVIVLTSVFTHMLKADVDHYLSEIARVAKPGAKVLMTFFVLNQASLAAVDRGESEISFGDDRGGYRLMNETYPEMAVGYDEDVLRAMLDTNGLELKEPIRYGAWTGSKRSLSFQDVVVAEKLATRERGSSSSETN